jgi:hypothetical protein
MIGIIAALIIIHMIICLRHESGDALAAVGTPYPAAGQNNIVVGLDISQSVHLLKQIVLRNITA